MDINELEVGGVIKKFKHRTILSDIHFTCITGEVTGILGRNGSGKTTLLQIIFGTMPADDKTIRFNHTVYSKPFLQGNLVAYLPQHSFLPKNTRIQQLIEIFISDKMARQRILQDEKITRHLNKTISELSGGELRYLEILLILNLPVQFQLLDEPFSGIEPIYKDSIQSLIHSYRGEKGFLISDQDYRSIIGCSDALFLINSGICQKIKAYQTELEDYNYVPKGTFTHPEQLDSASKPFDTDQQTLQDLDLFDSFYEGKLFNFFNKVSTPGGKTKLAEILKSPSPNIQTLESRRDDIKFLGEHGIRLDIDRKQITAIEYYLQSDIALFKNSPASSLISSLKYFFQPSSGYYTVRTGIQNIIQFLNNLDSLISKLRTKGTTFYLSELSFKIQDLLTEREIREIMHPETFLFPIGKLDHFFRNNKNLRALLDIIYELDVLESVSSLVSVHGFSYPVYYNTEEARVEVKGLFHPLINDAVPNDFSLNKNHNLCFLTGANMSGKSTFLKSFGIAVYLAHLGFPVPAAELKTSVFNGIRTTINLPDNIALGYSHFYSEVMRIKDIARAIQKNKKMIVILDELFKGTNVKDAAEASFMITTALSKINHCLFIVSTHHMEISEKLPQSKNIIFNHFEYKIINDEPSYTYKLKNGVSHDRAGLLIIKREGIQGILNDAADPGYSKSETLDH